MQGLFMAHPMLASRVYQAAVCACTPQAVAAIGMLQAFKVVISGAVWAAKVYNPIQLPAQSLLTGSQLAKRMGSQVCRWEHPATKWLGFEGVQVFLSRSCCCTSVDIWLFLLQGIMATV